MTTVCFSLVCFPSCPTRSTLAFWSTSDFSIQNFNLIEFLTFAVFWSFNIVLRLVNEFSALMWRKWSCAKNTNGEVRQKFKFEIKCVFCTGSSLDCPVTDLTLLFSVHSRFVHC